MKVKKATSPSKGRVEEQKEKEKTNMGRKETEQNDKKIKDARIPYETVSGWFVSLLLTYVGKTEQNVGKLCFPSKDLVNDGKVKLHF